MPERTKRPNSAPILQAGEGEGAPARCALPAGASYHRGRRDPGMAPHHRMGDDVDGSIWVWMIYQLDTRKIFGAIRCCERAH